MPNALVTGTSTGIGEACIARLAERGWTVYAGVRRAEDADRLKAQIRRRAPGHPRREQTRRHATRDREHPTRRRRERAARAREQRGRRRGRARRVRERRRLALGVRREPLRRRRAHQGRDAAAARGHRPHRAHRLDRRSHLVGRARPVQRVEARDRGARRVAASRARPVDASAARLADRAGRGQDRDLGQGRHERRRADKLLDDAARRDYQWLLDQSRGFIDEGRAKGVAASKVADAIEHASRPSRPKARYLVGPDAKLAGHLITRLPDRLRDSFAASARAGGRSAGASSGGLSGKPVVTRSDLLGNDPKSIHRDDLSRLKQASTTQRRGDGDHRDRHVGVRSLREPNRSRRSPLRPTRSPPTSRNSICREDFAERVPGGGRRTVTSAVGSVPVRTGRRVGLTDPSHRQYRREPSAPRTQWACSEHEPRESVEARPAVDHASVATTTPTSRRRPRRNLVHHSPFG